jgi:hypothetical protein
MEIRLIRTDTHMQTARAHSGSISGLNEDDLDTSLFRLVADHPLKFCEAPIAHNFRFSALSNPGEVFENDPLIGGFRLSGDLLADAMVGIRDESPLSTRDTLQSARFALLLPLA